MAGRRPVEEAFVARRVAHRLLVVPQRRAALEKLVLHATNLRIPIVEVEGGSLTALAGFDGHQGIALVVEPRVFASIDDLLARAAERREPPFILVLDSLEDPHNVGSLLRSAEAAGVHGVIFPTHRQAPLSPSAVKASAGAVEHLLLVPVDDLPGTLSDLHGRGVRIAGADGDAPMTARETDLRGPMAIVIGSEGQGLGPVVRRRCDVFMRIPMRGHVGSLNAAVAGSIMLFEAVAQRPAPEASATTAPPRAAESADLDGPEHAATTPAPSEPPEAGREVTADVEVARPVETSATKATGSGRRSTPAGSTEPTTSTRATRTAKPTKAAKTPASAEPQKDDKAPAVTAPKADKTAAAKPPKGHRTAATAKSPKGDKTAAAKPPKGHKTAATAKSPKGDRTASAKPPPADKKVPAPTKPTKAAKTAPEPTRAAKAGRTAKPTSAAKTATAPTKAAKTGPVAKPTKAGKTAATVEPMTPDSIVGPTKPTKPTKPAKTATPTKPTKPTKRTASAKTTSAAGSVAAETAATVAPEASASKRGRRPRSSPAPAPASSTSADPGDDDLLPGEPAATSTTKSKSPRRSRGTPQA